jgi:hypothetical protein
VTWWGSWILFTGEIRKPDEEFRVWKSDLDVRSYVLGAARMHGENEDCNVDGFWQTGVSWLNPKLDEEFRVWKSDLDVKSYVDGRGTDARGE